MLCPEYVSFLFPHACRTFVGRVTGLGGQGAAGRTIWGGGGGAGGGEASLSTNGALRILPSVSDQAA